MASNLVKRFREGIPAPHLQAKGAENVRGEDMWLDNDDIRPLKLADRTWNLWTYLTFWFSATATVSNWYAASSAQALGLSMWESVGTAFGGQVLIAIVITLNGRAGAKYHMFVHSICDLGVCSHVIVDIRYSIERHSVSLVHGGRLSIEQ